MRQWYTVYTKPRQEKAAEENLERQGYEVYCPRIQLDRRLRGRWQKIIEPLFPRYLFVHLEQGKDSFSPIRSTFGVSDFVRFGGEPKTVPNSLIEGIKAREDIGQKVHIGCRQWQCGDEVEIIEGSFVGLRGLFEASSSEERVIILLQLLGRDNKVRISRDAIVPA
jgi:transcriptional antiterminator RfaH